jgi:hypothetical protein
MVRILLHHHSFDFNRVFSDRANNEQVYRNAAEPLVGQACDGGFSTVRYCGRQSFMTFI